MSLHCGTVCGGGVQEGTMPLPPLSWLSVTSLATHKQMGPFWCWFPGMWLGVCSRTLWVSPTNSPVMLWVSPASSTPTGFFSQRFWSFIFLHWNPGLHHLSCSPVVPPSLSTCKCANAQSTSCHLSWSSSYHLVMSPLYPQWSVSAPPTGLVECFFCNSLVFDFYIVQFSGSSCYFLFLNLLLSSFWLYKEAKYIYLCLHLDQKSKVLNSFNTRILCVASL